MIQETLRLYQKTLIALCKGQVVYKSILIYKETQGQQNLYKDATFPRIVKMPMFLFPPRFPTLIWKHTNPSTVMDPLIPISPVVDYFLPLKP